ncbi:hypothetical protein ABTX35_37190, partial [Streptomyces sp. NPDC096080]|uniref:PspA/IM30 family protein n=1 Tax=Streptomyces sp. NPDC096080 TaxID=3156693 RepID=UPI003316C9D7
PSSSSSASHHPLDVDDGRPCLRAAQHDGDHTDERGFHWSDTVAVYPVGPAPWLLTGTRDLTIPEQRPADDEGERCITHWHGACDGTTPDCAFPIPGTRRRKSLRVLISRVNQGDALTTDEAQLLARHVATEICDASDGRRKVQRLQVALAEERSRWKERVEQALGERDRSDEAARRALEQRQEMAEERFVIQEQRDTADRLRAEARAELEAAQAAIKRVRAAVWAMAQELHISEDDGMRAAIAHVLAALDGTEPTTEQQPAPCPPGSAEDCAPCGECFHCLAHQHPTEGGCYPRR